MAHPSQQLFDLGQDWVDAMVHQSHVSEQISTEVWIAPRKCVEVPPPSPYHSLRPRCSCFWELTKVKACRKNRHWPTQGCSPVAKTSLQTHASPDSNTPRPDEGTAGRRVCPRHRGQGCTLKWDHAWPCPPALQCMAPDYLWFMVDITIVHGVYKRTFTSLGGHEILYSLTQEKHKLSHSTTPTHLPTLAVGCVHWCSLAKFR